MAVVVKKLHTLAVTRLQAGGAPKRYLASYESGRSELGTNGTAQLLEQARLNAGL
jgi:hypothetical protein